MAVGMLVLCSCGSVTTGATSTTPATRAPTLAPLTSTTAPSTTAPPTTAPPPTTSPPAVFASCGRGTSIADPIAPHGVFAVVSMPLTPALSAVLAKNVIPDASNCGVTINVRWADVDKGPAVKPQYDWRSVDAVAAPWLAADKVVNFAFEGVGDDVKGLASTPAYVQAKVGMVTCSAPNTPSRNPVYWDPVYQDAYRSFQLNAVAYTNTMKTVGYLRFGIGAGTQDLPALGYRTPACKSGWQAAGLTPAQWQSFSISQVDFQASLAPTHPVIVSVNELDAGDSTVANAVTAEAVQRGLGIAIQTLTKADPADIDKGQPCTANWSALFRLVAGHVPLLLQTATATDPLGKSATGDLPTLATFGLGQKAQIFEFYPDEWTLANDPTAKGYQQYHQIQHDALTALAIAVG